MKHLRTNITKRLMNRRLKDGTQVKLARYILHFPHPVTGKRATKYFETRKEAELYRNQLIADVSSGDFASKQNTLTVAEAVEYFLSMRKDDISPTTYEQYMRYSEYVTGPVLQGTLRERTVYRREGKLPRNAKFLPMLGNVKVCDLTTAQIRKWEQDLAEITTINVAARARQMLGLCLVLAEEEYHVRTPKMPRNLNRTKRKKPKKWLNTDQVALLLDAMRQDKQWGVYVAWPFLTGTRLGEQLGVLWEDIDFIHNQIHIRRTQMRDGTLQELAKTDSSIRIIPMCQELRQMLLAWRPLCPERDGHPHRVFPAQGYVVTRPEFKRIDGGGPLLHCNFRNRIWNRAFQDLDLPSISPHGARHTVISTLQSKGVEIGLVSKIAGHSNPRITLSYYTHPVREAGNAMNLLTEAYQPEETPQAAVGVV